MSIITPVYKKGSRSDPKNYRPIAQSSIPCLIMEAIIADHVGDFLRRTNQNDPHQHGFLKSRSTLTQLIEVAHFWATSKNQGIPLHCVYFDFSSAFDICNHEILLSKMSSLGLGTRIRSWCQSYLQDRSFQVKVGDSLSPPRGPPSAFPRGLVSDRSSSRSTAMISRLFSLMIV